MRYWWVNHKQTHWEELDGGYIWAPKTTANGVQKTTYTNLSVVQPGDFVLSYAFGAVQAVGVAQSPGYEAKKPEEFGAPGKAWNDDGWLVEILWNSLSRPLHSTELINHIRDLLPTKNSPLQANGRGNQGCYLAEISEVLFLKVLSLSSEIDRGQFNQDENLNRHELTEISSIVLSDAMLSTTKEQLIKARLGQGLFRKRVERFESKCRLTGITDKRFLVASHIKPWRDANNHERLDGENGLLLAPHADRLFDLGFITFRHDGFVLSSGDDINFILDTWSIPIGFTGGFTKNQNAYLDHHRKAIFRGSL